MYPRHQHREYNGLVLGTSRCKVPREFASVALDVDLSYSDIRPFHCPEKVCDSTGECLAFASKDCCKETLWSVCHYDYNIIIDGSGTIQESDSPCSDPRPLCVPEPTEPLELDSDDSCKCAEFITVRYANVVNGKIGILSPPSEVGVGTTITHGTEIALYVYKGGAWHLQGIDTEFDLTKVSIGEPPISDGWKNCPTNTKFLVRDKTGSLMTVSDDVIHISHPMFPHLWDMVKVRHCKKIIAMKEVRGTVYVFDGESVYTMVSNAGGFFLSEYAEDVCIKSEKQIATYKGDLFIMTTEGVISLLGDQRGLNLGNITDDYINPEYVRRLSDSWAIEVFKGRVHFSNGEVSYIYSMVGDRPKALTQSSLVAIDYYSDCDSIYYLTKDGVFEWNPVEGEDCPYKYCTGIDHLEGCFNVGVITVEGIENGGSTTEVIYLGHCGGESFAPCKHDTCLCEVMEITGCSNTTAVKICFEGLDHICSHELATAPNELR